MTIFALLPYDDGTSPRLKVDVGHTLLGGDQTVRIAAIGGDVSVLADDIIYLIGALRAAQQHFEP